MLDRLRTEAARLGKAEWRPMLVYVAELHARSILPPMPPFERPVEEIGPGYCYAPVFGHWDIVHAVQDSLPVEREHARDQLLNILSEQQPDGMLPGLFAFRGERLHFSTQITHPPVWPFAVQGYVDAHGDAALLPRALTMLRRQLEWFERDRRGANGGFHYLDVRGKRCWESGVDDGIRFEKVPKEWLAMCDATAHVYWLCEFGAAWAARLGEDAAAFERQAAGLREFIRRELFDDATGFFCDSWSRGNAPHAFEGMWPLVVGAATEQQAARVIDENLLNPRRYFTKHPLATVGVEDPRFELRMWRGPAWNSMTFWAAVGCMRYGRADAARRLLEAALDDTAAQYMRTGTIWEFYHPHGEPPVECHRKPYTPYNAPCHNYLGHNPVIAMARMWERTG